MSDQAPETAAELEAFRQKWREEVQARNKKSESSSSEATVPIRRQQRRQDPTRGIPSTARRREPAIDGSDEVEPKAYHDLPDKEEVLRLGTEGQRHDRNRYKEPSSALEHYERAVDKETAGQLGDSLAHYRKAFKLDDGVHEAYKMKHFPPSSFPKPKPSNPNPSNAATTVPQTGPHSLHGNSSSALTPSLQQLISDFSTLRIEPAPPPTDASPQEPSPLADLPEEILTQILTEVAIHDVAALVRMAQVCKRLAYLVLTEESVWKRVALGSEFGFGTMHYDYACDLSGQPLENPNLLSHYTTELEDPADDAPPPTPHDPARALDNTTARLLQSTYLNSHLHMFRQRPRLRFNGCYISTVNYTRPGATSTNTLTWGVPVHVVTYFRYLRFFRDGSCISLLTTTEPAEVVHHLTKEDLKAHANGKGGGLPGAVMKDALPGRWRLSGPASSTTSNEDVEEVEGEVHIETEGVVPKYTYKMVLGLGHAGKGTRNNKLAWKGFWSWNRLTDDWGEFGLKNDRAFYWSRVGSFGVLGG